MAKFIDLSGQSFGRLKVKEYLGLTDKKQHIWLCECECGNNIIVVGTYLTKGNTKSCGCARKETLSELFTKHKLCNTKFYHAYNNMKDRCTNTNNPQFIDYGGRGILICDRWLEGFRNFMEDMYDSYLKHVEEFGDKNTTLDRIDVNGNYCPENCRWATRFEQNNNTRTNHYITINGITKTMSEWAIEYNINYSVFRARVYNGDTGERLLRPSEFKPQEKQSGVKGVTWHERYSKWVARTYIDKKYRTVGYFNAIEEAIDAIQKYRENYKKEVV